MQNYSCNSEWSPKRVDSTNQKRLAVYACVNRDVFAGFLSSRRHNFPSKVKLCKTKLNGMSTCGCQSREMAAVLNSLSFVFKNLFLPKSVCVFLSSRVNDTMSKCLEPASVKCLVSQ